MGRLAKSRTPSPKDLPNFLRRIITSRLVCGPVAVFGPQRIDPHGLAHIASLIYRGWSRSITILSKAQRKRFPGCESTEGAAGSVCVGATIAEMLPAAQGCTEVTVWLDAANIKLELGKCSAGGKGFAFARYDWVKLNIPCEP